MGSISLIGQNKIVAYKHKNEIEKPFEKDIYLFTTYIAGIRYINGIDELAKTLEENEELKLIREPLNQHDERAILVKNKNNIKLGYIPMHDNEVFTRLLDAGKHIYAKIKTIIPEHFGETVDITIDLYMRD